MLKIVLAAAAAFIAVADTARATDPRSTITIAADVWCPVNCDADTPPHGVGIDLAQHIFEPLGYEVRYVTMPWARALEEVREGKVDAVVGANQEDDTTLLFPKEPICAISDDIYVRDDHPLEYAGLDSLVGQRIGIIKDYGYDDSIQALLEVQRKTPGAVQEVAGDDALQQNIRKLLAHRIDVIIESRPVMEYTLQRQKLQGRIRHVGSIPQGHVYLAFSPALERSRQRLKQYDEGIVRLKVEGLLADIYKPYGLQPPP